MELRTLIFIGLGGFAICAGGVLTLVAAFRQHVLWGLAVLLLPLANLVYTVKHWAAARNGFLTTLAGTLLIAIGLASSPAARTALVQLRGLDLARQQMSGEGFALQPAAAPSLDEQLRLKRASMEQMEGRFSRDGQLLVQEFNALTEQRRLLKPSDAPAVDAFNKAVAEYQTHNQARQVAKDQLAALRGEIDRLQDERSRQRSAAATPSRKVVIYTTATCPACIMAKAYFAKKGVPYEEHDVNNNAEARAEFQKLGGRGVPLIMVGTERMEGFNAQRLDQLL